jgi:hypothetical protein
MLAQMVLCHRRKKTAKEKPNRPELITGCSELRNRAGEIECVGIHATTPAVAGIPALD